MKYVRVYESDCCPEEYVTTYLTSCEHIANLQNAGFDFEGCVVKQADTIEELCDEFVGIDNQGHYLIHNDEWLDGARIVPIQDIQYYGAIWTDKGLIYVAKLNDKGELELL